MKLLELRDWLNLVEGASMLGRLIGEVVSEADLLRLAMDGHLTLSVNFVNLAKAKCGRAVPVAEAKTHELPSLLGPERFIAFVGLQVSEDTVIELEPQVVTLEGVWDLSMLGAERLDVEHRYHHLTGGPEVELVSLVGAILRAPDGSYFQLQQKFQRPDRSKMDVLELLAAGRTDYFPAGTLPEDAVLVVRTSELRRFAKQFSAPKATDGEASVGTRERTTLLVMLAAMAKLAKLDLSKPSSAAATLEAQTELMGARVASRTIEEHLKRVADALERKSAA